MQYLVIPHLVITSVVVAARLDIPAASNSNDGGDGSCECSGEVGVRRDGCRRSAHRISQGCRRLHGLWLWM